MSFWVFKTAERIPDWYRSADGGFVGFLLLLQWRAFAIRVTAEI
jgi:hypothetical protein